MLELLLTLLVLYALQCVVLLPRGATLFGRLDARWHTSEGPGWRMLHPWPSAAGWLATRPPLLEDDGELRTRGPTPWLGAGYAGGEGLRVVPGGGQSVKVRGRRVLIDGVPAMRGATQRQAAELGGLLGALVGEAADAKALLDAWLARSFAAKELAEARERSAAATRWLGIFSDLGLVAFFVTAPLLAAWLGGERLLVFGFPIYLALHVVSWVLLVRAYAVMHPESEERFEVLFAAAIYPPVLVRAASELRRQSLCGFHPAAVAAEVLPRAAALDFLRTELLRASGESERAAVADVVERLGSTPEALFAPPERSDPYSSSYCPTCRTEYRLESGACIDCDIALEPLEPDELGGDGRARRGC